MPNSLESVVVFVFVIAPGYLLVRGFSVGRTQVPPGRDLYVLAEAVVASVAWMALLYLVAHNTFDDYGLLPRADDRLEEHGADVARLLLLLVVAAPYVAGRVAGFVVRVAARSAAVMLAAMAEWLDKPLPNYVPAGTLRKSVAALRGLALLTPPTAWDRSWSRVDPATTNHVAVHLKDGIIVRGTLASVDRSPLPHQVELASGQAYDEGGNPLGLGAGTGGVYLEGGEIRAVYFE